MIERIEISYVSARGNIYHVPKKQWRKWGIAARQVFNEVYSSMTKNECLFLHPEQTPPSKRHWKTTAWNAAWTAASASQEGGVIGGPN